MQHSLWCAHPGPRRAHAHPISAQQRCGVGAQAVAHAWRGGDGVFGGAWRQSQSNNITHGCIPWAEAPHRTPHDAGSAAPPLQLYGSASAGPPWAQTYDLDLVNLHRVVQHNSAWWADAHIAARLPKPRCTNKVCRARILLHRHTV